MNEFEKYMNIVRNAVSWEDKEYAMVMAIDSLPEGTSDGERDYIWKQMLQMA